MEELKKLMVCLILLWISKAGNQGLWKSICPVQLFNWKYTQLVNGNNNYSVPYYY